MHTIKLNYTYPEKTDQHMVEAKPLVDIYFDAKYPYYKDGFFYRFLQRATYIFAYTIGYIVCFFNHRIKFNGRKNFRKYKSELSNGCITVCNHVFHLDFLCIMIGIRPNLVYYPAWNIKLRDKHRKVANATGAIPLPDNLGGWVRFSKALYRHMDNGHWLHFFPEGAMWPFYQEIRPFKKGAFEVADKSNRPILPMAFAFRNPTKFAKLLGLSEPFATLNIGEPMYADKGIINRNERIDDFQARVESAVKELSE